MKIFPSPTIVGNRLISQVDYFRGSGQPEGVATSWETCNLVGVAMTEDEANVGLLNSSNPVEFDVTSRYQLSPSSRHTAGCVAIG